MSEDEVKTFCDQEESERANDCPQVSVDPLETLLDLIGTLDINPLCRPFKIAKVLKTGVGEDGEESIVQLKVSLTVFSS